MPRLNLLRFGSAARFALAKRVTRKAWSSPRGDIRSYHPWSAVYSPFTARMARARRTARGGSIRLLNDYGFGSHYPENFNRVTSRLHSLADSSTMRVRGVAGALHRFGGRRGRGAFGGPGAFQGMGRGWKKFIKGRRR